MSGDAKWSKRETEVMDVLFRRGSATAREVWSELGEQRTYSTIRKLLSILEEKGQVTHRRDGAAFVYSPSQRRDRAAKSAMSRVVETFFQGSVEGAVSSLLGSGSGKLSKAELDRIAQMIEAAKVKAESDVELASPSGKSGRNAS